MIMMNNLPSCDVCGYQGKEYKSHFCLDKNTDQSINSLLDQILVSLKRIKNKLSKYEKEDYDE
jgi:hypothetical protein